MFFSLSSIYDWNNTVERNIRLFYFSLIFRYYTELGFYYFMLLYIFIRRSYNIIFIHIIHETLGDNAFYVIYVNLIIILKLHFAYKCTLRGLKNIFDDKNIFLANIILYILTFTRKLKFDLYAIQTLVILERNCQVAVALHFTPLQKQLPVRYYSHCRYIYLYYNMFSITIYW